VADYVLRVYDLDFITVSDITSGNGACSRLGQGQSYLVLAFQLHSDTFQVEQDFKNVFLYTFFAAVLLQYPSISTSVTAQPGIEDSKIRRRALPSV
jgi:hypothetical protein